MVRILAIVVALCACGGGKGGGVFCVFGGETHEPGDVFPAGDGCNSCECGTDGEVTCTEIACPPGVDANPASCAPSGGCPNGPVCDTSCCGPGERCNNGTCVCGPNPACGAGDSCEAAGPIGGDACGSICCGATGPCPQ